MDFHSLFSACFETQFFLNIKQAGGEFTDFIIVLRTKSAVKTFCGNMHFSFGAGLSAAAGIVGRAAEVDVRAGGGGYAACYTYSCSKGEILFPNNLRNIQSNQSIVVLFTRVLVN